MTIFGLAPTQIIGICGLAAIFLGIILLNMYAYERRAKMTPEERKREDEETDRKLFIW